MPINDQLGSRLVDKQNAETAALVAGQTTQGGRNFLALNEADAINFGDDFDFAAQAAQNQRSNRAAALKQLTIQRKKLEFQKRTGLRDIGQARTKGLKGAISDALQRGIFNSGIRIENEAEVNREADEAKSDLKTEIQFSLDDLAARRQGLNAQRFGTGSGRKGGLTEQEGTDLANEQAANQFNQPAFVPAGPQSDVNQRRGVNVLPTTGVIPLSGPN